MLIGSSGKSRMQMVTIDPIKSTVVNRANGAQVKMDDEEAWKQRVMMTKAMGGKWNMVVEGEKNIV
jgi:hypothetical protein